MQASGPEPEGNVGRIICKSNYEATAEEMILLVQGMVGR